MPIRFSLVEQSGRRPRFAVIGLFANGEARPVGQIEHRWFRHLQRNGWLATATDGTHRSVHNENWQAAWACGWDGAGNYPFPVPSRYRGLVEAA